jgi:eukaryotic-like serine/threonine-protein kinase
VGEEKSYVGEVLGGYRAIAELGRGGMGIVLRATHVETGQAVALKVMSAVAAMKPEMRKRFAREARATRATPHPNIVHVYEAFEHEGLPVIALELLEGESLEEHLKKHGKLDLAETARIGMRVTSAVGTAHAAGIVHRDLKPDNIFLVRAPAPDVKVLDFGIAKLTASEGLAAETAALTRTGALMGTPYYMSPEQSFGEKKIDHRADIWSLGIILYRCLTGVLPTRGDTLGDVLRKVVSADFQPLRELAPSVPEEVASLVHQMLRLRPDDRPWDLREIHDVLTRHADASAPAFGTAVEPVYQEESSQGDAAEPAAATVETLVTSPPLALTPSSLKLTPGGLRPAPRTPSGTVMIDEPSASAERGGSRPKPAAEDSVAGSSVSLGEAPAAPRGLPVAVIVLATLAIIGAVIFAVRMFG